MGDKKYTWFVWALAGLYLFIPVINSFIKEFGLGGVKYYLVIWAVIILLTSFGLYPFNSFELSYFAGYLGYLLLGYYLVNVSIDHKKRAMILSLLLCILSLFIHALFRYKQFGIITVTEYLNLFVVFESACFVLFCRCFEENSWTDLNSVFTKLFNFIKNSFLAKVILSISILSYSMYFTHIIVINFINHYTQAPNILIYYGFVIIFAWLMSFVFSKIPYVGKYTGI